MLRWSDAWEKASLVHLQDKWNLSNDIYFSHKYKALGWRRRKMILSPILHRFTFGLLQGGRVEAMTFGLVKDRFVEKLLMYGLLAPIDRVLNTYLTYRHRRQWLKPLPLQPSQSSLTRPIELPSNPLQRTADENSSAA